MPYFSSVVNYSWLQKSATLEMSNSAAKFITNKSHLGKRQIEKKDE